MNRCGRIGVIMGLCAVLSAGFAWANSSPFVGRWHWNKAHSTPPRGEPMPQDFISEISRADPGTVNWSITILTPDGQSYAETFEAAADGEFRPLSDDTTVSFRLSSDTLQATFKGPAGQSDAQTCTLSADQKQMICKGILTKGNGQTADYVDVYDRM